MANFRLGFFGFTLHMVDSRDSMSNMVRQIAQTQNPALGKRYVCVLQIGNTSWLWFTSDDLIECENEYKEVLTKLKEGDNVVFEDHGEPKTRSVRLSWRALEIEW